jgi:hypothetical protein
LLPFLQKPRGRRYLFFHMNPKVMMRTPIRMALVALVLSPALAFGWGGEGHRTVCGVAWQRLSPDGRTFADRLLGTRDMKSFVDACVWADSVRSDRPATYNYHFINIPAGSKGMNMGRDCAAPKRCAPWAIVHYARIMADANAAAIDRREALMFVLHFVGDLHQPLHAGRPGDRGGNDVAVDFFGDAGDAQRRNNLHSVWDSQMLRRAGVEWGATSHRLNNEVSRDEAREWETLDIADWSNESYRVCEEFVYGKLRADGRIRNTYFKPALGIAEVQMQKGGVRLAHLINSAATGNLSGLSLSGA